MCPPKTMHETRMPPLTTSIVHRTLFTDHTVIEMRSPKESTQKR